jgi:3-dehydroquinate synthase
MPKFEELSGLKNIEPILIPEGDDFKNLQTAEFIWESLFKKKADRYALLINLGGGMINDLGGFCAGTYFRGIDFVHVPTTVLAQVDASIGGKVAIDYKKYKNLIGLFKNPAYVFIETQFLQTLPENQYRSGFVELLKHAIIASPHLLSEIEKKGVPKWDKIYPFLEKSLMIKRQIIEADPYDHNKRQVLNFGHSVGHAVESLCSELNQKILHGEAVAFGMMVESMLSYQTNDFPKEDLDRLMSLLHDFSYKKIKLKHVDGILDGIKRDKKNFGKELKFTLIRDIGNAHYGYSRGPDAVRNALELVIDNYF